MGLVYGVGINDAGYTVKSSVNGVYWGCKYYQVWKGILERCYSGRLANIRPTYQGCSVTPEWHRFSNFKAWMETQHWEGKELDKDLKIKGNKVYGPDTCTFVSGEVNRFIVGSVKKKDLDLPVNITRLPSGSFRGVGTENGKVVYLGSSTNLELITKLVDEHKKRMANDLADKEPDPFVANLIRERYN